MVYSLARFALVNRLVGDISGGLPDKVSLPLSEKGFLIKLIILLFVAKKTN